MRRALPLSVLLLLAIASSGWAQGRRWVLPVNRLDGSGWTTELSGGYPGADDGKYYWASGQNGERRAWWRFQDNFVAGPGFTTENPPEEPRLYFIRCWIPPAHSSTYSVIETDVMGQVVPDTWPKDSRIPWNGWSGTNFQWISRDASNQGTWVQAGNLTSGPHAPVADQNDNGVYYSICGAGATGDTVWLRRGDELYVKWDFAGGLTTGVSAIEITEANTIPPGWEPVVCGAPSAGGPVDIRCIGNADPLYGVGASDWWDSAGGEPFANAHTKMIAQGDSTLAAEGYRIPCSTGTQLSPGLPPSGTYVAHLAEGDITFQLQYGGMAALKWDAGQTDPGSPFFNGRSFTLNGTAGQEFVPAKYDKLYLLSTKNGGNNSQLLVEAVYSDGSSSFSTSNLYDWFGGDGDALSQAVGVDGYLRSGGESVIGFRRINNEGAPANGGDHGGAFFYVHTVDVSSGKVLEQVQISVQADGRGFGGWINVVAASLVPATCGSPVFDVVGGGVDGEEPDGVVDMNDFGVFQRCWTGNDASDFDPTCACLDVVQDQLINELDFAYFLQCETGPSPASPPPAGCDRP